ncbi:MAG: type II toxin-antitoxin system RelE/ParE family toxin [Desulfosporosinus sp.]|nr:type II toxin-antitoxin system RelE/ParE family toxin [Desulfosporosinus sp.]
MTLSEYHVFWTQTAQKDLKRIIKYVVDNGIQARRVYLAIKQKADNLRVLVEKPCWKGSMNWSYFASMVIKKRL